MTTETTQAGRVTIYKIGEFGMGYRKIEASRVAWGFGRYAQYDNAVTVEFTPKGARKALEFVETRHASTIILDGWGHPDPDSMWGEANGGTQTSRHRAFDRAWESEFAAQLAAHVAATGAKILADFRGHDPKDRFGA